MKMPDTKTQRRMLPFAIQFVRFATGFAAILAIALLILRIAGS